MTDPQRVENEAAGPADFLRRLEGSAASIEQIRGALQDELNLRDDLMVRAIELYGSQGSTGVGMLSTRQVARSAGVSQGHLGRILAAT